MSDCLKQNFTITKGISNSYTFTIKQTGTTLPMELAPSDTIIARLYLLSDDSEVLTKPLTLDTNLLTGIVHLNYTSSDTTNLISEKGSKADRYYVKPMYRLLLDCTTTNNGNFTARVDLVYVV